MSDSAEARKTGLPRPGDFDEVPVEDLIRLTREFTRRITNQDRQRLGLELRESGHSRSLQTTAPLTLQQFFSGEIDLDTDLAQRFANAPLLSHIQFMPRPGEPVRRQASAILSSNDDSTALTVNALLDPEREASLEFTVTLHSALALRFDLAPLVASDRSHWLELMRRPNGIAFLWTRDRWEKPYLVFVVREHFARLYAFSPHGYEAAARLTPDTAAALLDWLEGLWFPEQRPPDHEHIPATARPDAYELRTHVERPARARPTLRSVIPDAPEEQWEDQAPPPSTPDVEETDLSASDLEW
jgi:hypothetical protein